MKYLATLMYNPTCAYCVLQLRRCPGVWIMSRDIQSRDYKSNVIGFAMKKLYECRIVERTKINRGECEADCGGGEIYKYRLCQNALSSVDEWIRNDKMKKNLPALFKNPVCEYVTLRMRKQPSLWYSAHDLQQGTNYNVCAVSGSLRKLHNNNIVERSSAVASGQDSYKNRVREYRLNPEAIKQIDRYLRKHQQAVSDEAGQKKS